MTDWLWKLEQVTLHGTHRPRLVEVDLEIRPGVTAVVGHSGAGKTSLLNLLVGFEQPDRGRVRFGLPLSADRLPLFWVPQTGGLWPHLTVTEHLQAVRPGGASGTLCGRIGVLLADFDLAARADAKPDRLSYGERRRLAVARALASEASVLVMDEPLVHVDPLRVGRYWEALRAHAQRNDSSLVVATHSPETVLCEAETAVCISEGRIEYVGPVSELYHRPANPRLAGFLGVHNWLTDEEARQWLNGQNAGGRCYRPEQIAIVEDEQGPFVVESARFAGSIAEAVLRDPVSGRRRRFYYRPADAAIQPGMSVTLRVVTSEQTAGALEESGVGSTRSGT